mmetsp:Transcript_90218/g.280873  ORF Transcript_90218/g.280873 Transcript_90218/m.280873 type:complete len:301 (+) Transcript_90218:1469-2371(+)
MVAPHSHMQGVDLEALVTKLLHGLHAGLGGLQSLVRHLRGNLGIDEDEVAKDCLALVGLGLEPLEAVLCHLHGLPGLLGLDQRVRDGQERGRLPALAVADLPEDGQGLAGQWQSLQWLLLLQVRLSQEAQLEGLKLLDAHIAENGQDVLHLGNRLGELPLQDVRDGDPVHRPSLPLLIADLLEEGTSLLGRFQHLVRLLLADSDMGELQQGRGSHLRVVHLSEEGQGVLCKVFGVLVLGWLHAAAVALALREREQHGSLPALVVELLELRELLVGDALSLHGRVAVGDAGLQAVQIDDHP